MYYRADPLPLPVAGDSGGFLTPAEFAKANGVSLSTVWRLLRRRELASIKRRGKRFIAPGAVIRTRKMNLPLTAEHPIWALVGAGKSGGAGPGSSDKRRYLADEARAGRTTEGSGTAPREPMQRGRRRR